ncbi:MAG TPA: ABC transporter permease [Ruminiclostridium sp.]|nr:ABC transporter permease [Ruminiclostridium sp.]
MNIFHKVTLKTLQKNRTRTLVTIIGIILSAAMFTAVTTFISSLQNFMMNVVISEEGDWHGCLYAATSEKVSELKGNDEINQLALAQNIGYAALQERGNEYKPYLHILGVDTAFKDTMPIHLVSGRLPENPSELILPAHLKTNGGVSNSLGDLLDLAIGDRVSEGTVLDQHNPYLNGEKGQTEELVIRENRSYTVVGFYERPSFEDYSAPGYTAITVQDVNPGPHMTFNAYFKMQDPGKVYKYLNQQSNGEGFSAALANSDVLLFSGEARYDSFFQVLYSLAAILIGIIMFGSVSLIYNAFSISVSERTKQFGLLSSIGATRKQIKNSVFFEAFFVSSIGIPLGILSGILGIGVTLALVGDIFSSLYSNARGISFSLHVNLWSIIIAGAVAFITVIISAWIPSRRVSKITAIEAIRQSYDITAKAKKIKTSRLIYRLFGLEGMIARKHFKRNRRKYRATVVSLFMSIVLFISASSFSAYLKDSVGDVFETQNYDIVFSMDRGAGEDSAALETYDSLKNVAGVKESSFTYVEYCQPDIPEEYLTGEYIKEHEEGNGHAFFYGVDDETYLKFLNDNGLDPAVFMKKGDPVGIALSTTQFFDYNEQKYKSYKVFKMDQPKFDLLVLDQERFNALTEEERQDLENPETPGSIEDYYLRFPVRIGAVLDTLPTGVNGNYNQASVTVMYPMSLMDEVLPQMGDSQITMYFTAKNHGAVYDKMAEVLAARSMGTEGLYDYAASTEMERNLILVMNVFSYGFIVLISLIAVANVFNTICTNIMLRRREFAMLKSVGMTQKGFSRMMNFECWLYGAKSLLYGLPVSVGVTFLIYKSISAGYTASFYIPWQALVIAVFSVFAVVFATMLYSISKIRKENPIDALRNENL